MKWFGRKAAGRGSVRPGLARGWGIPAGGGDECGTWARSYDGQLRASYLGNAVAQRAVRLVAESVGEAPVSASDEEVRGLIAMRSAGQALLETVAAQMLLHGNAYIQIITDGAGRPRELFALRPERISIEVDGQGWPIGYAYRVGADVSQIAARDEMGRPAIIHVKSFHPMDDHYGLGCLDAASGAVAIHNAATRWNKALLDNAARPSGALMFDPGDGATLSPEQFERLRCEMEAHFQGATNAGRPMLLEGGLKWQAMSMTPADMDFVGLKAAAAREIALAFGVPPMLLGLPGDNSYANYREATRALWRLSVLPLSYRILGALAQGLRPWWPELALGIDLDRVTALSEDRERQWAQVAGVDFLSADEKRAVLGLAPALAGASDAAPGGLVP